MISRSHCLNWHGEVTHEGEVEWQSQKDVAESVVRRISGVSGVTNLITIQAE